MSVTSSFAFNVNHVQQCMMCDFMEDHHCHVTVDHLVPIMAKNMFVPVQMLWSSHLILQQLFLPVLRTKAIASQWLLMKLGLAQTLTDMRPWVKSVMRLKRTVMKQSQTKQQSLVCHNE